MNKAELLNDLIRSRRSVFPDQWDPGQRVDDAIVKQALINATWAPNHGQAEPWLFRIYTKDGLKKLADFQSELYRELSGERFKEATYFKLQQNPLKASHVISIGMKKTESKSIPEVEDIAAVACAVQNIYLTVTAYGAGGYWSTGGITYYPEAKPFFGLAPEDRLMGFFFIGIIKTPSVPARRKPIEEKTEWITG